ncbi:hypothetical protein PHJA_002335500 [Phtheirospermum japonicum]|uniref:Transmembrane protein 220 n=1 Tax=Phtheirospermum japonicum TaxID=374723 RepID=A0A830D427_9LAMI|nr:hypothetical protein PHJA_002335500 [Phtheirospermum japonicum]
MSATSKNSLLGVGICNLLMASLFALSACFQFNDSDWYFWIPLYATACIVNLVKWAKKPNSRMRKMAKFALWLGIFLFIKVSIEDFSEGTTIAGFWSLNMRERIVREKFGSGLVISSIFLLLQNSNPRPTLITKHV